VNGVYVAGKYAYLAVDNIGLCILDITNPANPQAIGEGGFASLFTQGVAIAGQYAYLATSYMGLDIFDIANAAIPRQVGALALQATTQAIYVAGPYAYLATSDSGLQIVDIANPANPQLVGAAAAIGSAREVTVSGQYAYIATEDRGLQIVTIADPTNPQPVGQGMSAIGSAQGVYVSGQYAFVATSDQGLQIVDISDPSNPLQVGAGLAIIGAALGVYVAGQYAYVAASDQGLHIVDITDPANPQLTGAGVDAIGSTQAVHVAGKYAYIAAGAAGLQIIDLQGSAIFAATIGAVAANVMNVAENAVIGNDLSVRSGLNVGPGGIKSDGPMQAKDVIVTGTLTAVRFEGDGSGLTGIQGAGGSGPWAAKADNTGIVYKAGLNVTIGAANSGTSLQILNRYQDAAGDTLVLGRTEGSHLRLGYHGDYSWLQSSTGKPLLLNPLENNVGIGITGPTHALHVGVGKSVRHELGPDQKLSLGGNGAFEIDAPNIVGGRFVVSNGGNVGIGAPDPQEKLVVDGTVAAARFVGDGSGLTGLQAGTASQWTSAANGVIHYAGGNVGINTTAPVGRLDVRADDYQFTLTNSDHNDSWGLTNWNHKLLFQYRPSATGNALNQVVIEQNGNVGIGTTNASQKLTVSAASTHLQLRREATETGGGKQLFLELYQEDSRPVPNVPEVYPSIRFHHNNRFWHRMEARPDGFHFKDGNLNADGLSKIEAGDASFNGNIVCNGRIYARNGLVFYWGPDRGWKILDNRSHVAIPGTYAGTVPDGGPSDLRFKTDVRPLRNALEKVLQLQGALYRWGETGLQYFTRHIAETVSAGPNATEEEDQQLRAAERQKAYGALAGEHIGLIAQDVETIVPEVVHEDEEGYKYIRYQQLTALLVEAIKEQNTLIQGLSLKVAALESA
jgi:hypothetical protein